ncbi:MAG: endonuclease III [Treponemataceae bacterium]
MPDRTNLDWDALFSALYAWRAKTLAADNEGRGGEDPSVTAIAGETDRDPWAVLVSTIISLRTKDAVTVVASRRLLAEAGTPQALLTLSEEEIAALIHPAGFFRTKAKSLRTIAAILIERYAGKVPADKDQLMELPGVGLKTANLVLSEAFDQDAICVDIHVHRISNRVGWISTKTPDESETALRAILPRKYWKRINALLVLYGQRVCAPVSPKCSICAIKEFCERVGVTKTR